MTTINYSEKIPNNVNLSEDRTLQRALEQWQPNYLSWWNDMALTVARTSTSICARPSVSTPKAGHILAT